MVRGAASAHLAQAQALVSACECKLDLVLSTLVTDAVNASAQSPPIDRFAVLLYALRSYAPLPIERAYLYVELAPSYAGRAAELRAAARDLFGTNAKDLLHGIFRNGFSD